MDLPKLRRFVCLMKLRARYCFVLLVWAFTYTREVAENSQPVLMPGEHFNVGQTASSSGSSASGIGQCDSVFLPQERVYCKLGLRFGEKFAEAASGRPAYRDVNEAFHLGAAGLQCSTPQSSLLRNVPGNHIVVRSCVSRESHCNEDC